MGLSQGQNKGNDNNGNTIIHYNLNEIESKRSANMDVWVRPYQKRALLLLKLKMYRNTNTFNITSPHLTKNLQKTNSAIKRRLPDLNPEDVV